MSAESCSIAQQSLLSTSPMTLSTRRGVGTYLAMLGAAVLLAMPSSAFADLLASAKISTASTTAPYNYSLTLNNIGTTDIGTFWFAWTAVPANYDFLPSAPTFTSMPAGWVAPITHSGIPGDGYAIEFFNVSGSPITPHGNRI